MIWELRRPSGNGKWRTVALARVDATIRPVYHSFTCDDAVDVGLRRSNAIIARVG